jgi:NADP-dependent 3-hydroxy acid dehydrogenase YdfG
MAEKIWFITGTSRGFGKVWAEAALKRGDKVAAAARNVNSLNELVAKYGDSILPLQLDVTDRQACFDAVKKAHDYFGRIDVVINNAGYGLFGTIEEITEKEAREQIETNLFGALWVTQAVIPIMRQQKSGHILPVSSIGGVAAFPMLGLYHASKWGLEAFSESLAGETAGFGIKVTIIEPGGYATDWAGSSAKHSAPIDVYTEVKDNLLKLFSSREPGNPAATAEAVLKAVDSENPPLRLFLGKYVLDIASHTYSERLKTWNEWKDVSAEAHGN